MQKLLFTTRGHSGALTYASKELESNGWIKSDTAPVVILPVPSFDPGGNLKGGGCLEDLGKDCIIIGGNLTPDIARKHRHIDLLKNPLYLSENALITAHCALCIAMENLSVTLSDCSALVIGWGRIGKHLARLLRLLGAQVTIAARSESDRALTEALGYAVMDTADETADLSKFRVIFNTVPAMVLPEERMVLCRKDCLKIDLASKRGIGGSDVIWARGLPSLDAPESSGKLIAKIIRKEFEG